MTFLIILGREYGVGFSRFEHISAWEQSLSNWLTTLPLQDVYCFIVLKSCQQERQKEAEDKKQKKNKG